MSPEFNLIQQYFTRTNQHTDLSIGDDAALFQVQPGHQLAVSTDMLIAGTHFYPDADPSQLGWKALAVNLSDMAAMGAQAKWATLSIALPAIQPDWLQCFSQGLFDCAQQFNIDLIGGDTTKGPLAINITIMGEVANTQALTRHGACIDDDIWVSGQLGNAALALMQLQNKWQLDTTQREQAFAALHTPEPRCGLGLALRQLASSCIDLSDGLLADLSHVLTASEVGAHIMLEKLPIHAAIAQQRGNKVIQQAILAGGEDYELCFTAHPSHREQIAALQAIHHCNITRIGNIQQSPKLTVVYEGQPISLSSQGYDHFA